eukprot:6008920-Pleurochrysis_carterae.AAC.1
MRSGAGCAAFGGLRIAGPSAPRECRVGHSAGICALHLPGPAVDSLGALHAVWSASQHGGGAAVQLVDA